MMKGNGKITIKAGIDRYIAILILFFVTASAFAQESDTTSQESILKKKKRLNAFEYILGDTTDQGTPEELQEMPGGKPGEYLPQQDSAYFKSLKARIPVATRLMRDLRATSDLWEIQREIYQGKPWQVALQNLNSIPDEAYEPSPVEMVHQQEAIRNALYTPGALNLRPNIQIPLGSIAQFFGFSEDVSPVIEYSLEVLQDVEIVIYSLNATVIATLFEGEQPAGNYRITWNLRDDEGRKMPSGDYIAEVRIGNSRYVRKRIVIP